MTKEEAINKLKLLDNYSIRYVDAYGERDHDAMMLAIKALEFYSDGWTGKFLSQETSK